MGQRKKAKREEMIEWRKAEAMAAKRRRARGGISSFSEKKDESDTKDDTDPDKANPD